MLIARPAGKTKVSNTAEAAHNAGILRPDAHKSEPAADGEPAKTEVSEATEAAHTARCAHTNVPDKAGGS